MSELEKTKFKVKFEYTEYACYDVEANTEDEAMDIAISMAKLDYDNAEFYDIWEVWYEQVKK